MKRKTKAEILEFIVEHNGGCPYNYDKHYGCQIACPFCTKNKYYWKSTPEDYCEIVATGKTNILNWAKSELKEFKLKEIKQL